MGQMPKRLMRTARLWSFGLRRLGGLNTAKGAEMEDGALNEKWGIGNSKLEDGIGEAQGNRIKK
jgi:hypothetical protein